MLEFTTRYDRDILALAVPALGTLAVGPLVSLVDTAFVGQLGRVPLAALGVNASVFSLAFIVFNFLAYATTPRVASAYGRGDLEEAGRTVVQALMLATGLGLAATLVLEAGAPLILRAMGAGGDLMTPALRYLRIRALAGPAVLLVLAGHGAFRGYQDTRTPLYVSLALNAVNAALDPLLIFGLGWGLTGAATATAGAQWTGALGFLWLLLGRRREALGVVLEWPRLRALLPFMKAGWTLASRTLALTGTMALATAVAARVGTAEVAAHQVAAQCWSFLALVVDALAVAAQALVARYLGENQPGEARAVANRLLVMGGAVGAALGVGFWLTQPVLPALFTDDPATTRLLLAVVPFVALMQPLNALVFVGDGVFLGLEDFSYLAKAMVASAAGAAAVLLLVVPLGWGLAGVWWGLVTLMALRLVTLGARYVRAGLFAGAAEGEAADEHAEAEAH
ncbi:MAG: MATE family efflux transporter [Bacteroidetes bacterium SW_4_67_19]|nr:MAG: MATE family efflux transporter [Bacteroidetes bacterium SW_4_67_19]